MKQAKAPPRRTPDESETALRERICNAAFGAFMARGYAGTSTLEIATRAKVSKRELYALFKNKEAMLAAGLENRTQRMQIAATLPEPRDSVAFRAILTEFAARLLREVTHPTVIGMYRLAIAERERAPEVAQLLNAAGPQATRRALAEFFAGAQRARLLKPGDSAELASAFLSLLWRNLMMTLLLGVAERPSDAECRQRAEAAAVDFLTLHGAEGPARAGRA